MPEFNHRKSLQNLIVHLELMLDQIQNATDFARISDALTQAISTYDRLEN